MEEELGGMKNYTFSDPDAGFQRRATATFMANPELMAPAVTEQPSGGLLSHNSLFSHTREWPAQMADEEDAVLLGEPRGQVYTVEEVRAVVAITAPESVVEVHRWKQTFNARLRPDDGS